MYNISMIFKILIIAQKCVLGFFVGAVAGVVSRLPTAKADYVLWVPSPLLSRVRGSRRRCPFVYVAVARKVGASLLALRSARTGCLSRPPILGLVKTSGVCMIYVVTIFNTRRPFALFANGYNFLRRRGFGTRLLGIRSG